MLKNKVAQEMLNYACHFPIIRFMFVAGVPAQHVSPIIPTLSAGSNSRSFHSNVKTRSRTLLTERPEYGTEATSGTFITLTVYEKTRR